MILDDLEVMRQQNAEGVSDFALDSLLSDSLPTEMAKAVRVRLENDIGGAARLADFAVDPPRLNDARILAAMRRAVAARDRRGRLAELVRFKWLGGLAALGIAGAGLLLMGPLKKQEGLGVQVVPETRTKGGLRLEARLMRDQVVRRLLNGDEVGAGDTLRFVVTLPSKGRVAVLGIESTGKLYTAWPLAEHKANPVFDAGSGVELPGAVQLFGPRGDELLVLVLCPEAVPLKCVSKGASVAPSCPSVCSMSTLKIRR